MLRSVQKLFPNRPKFCFACKYSDKGASNDKPKQANDKIKPNDTVKDMVVVQSEHPLLSASKYAAMILGFSCAWLAFYIVAQLGMPRVDQHGKEIKDEFSDLHLFQQYILRALSEISYYQQLLREPTREKLLPDVVSNRTPYTLVLEFTDVLVHPVWTRLGFKFKKRPGLDHFLETLSEIYEIVVYTSEEGTTVFPVISAVDAKHLIRYKLVKEATSFINGEHIKDLQKLNRDLRRTIVVDWNPDSTKFHPENVFQIPRWEGNDDDLTLIHLASFLVAISKNQIEDVREVVKYYNQFDDALATFRDKQKRLIEMAEEAAAGATQEPGPLHRVFKNLFWGNV